MSILTYFFVKMTRQQFHFEYPINNTIFLSKDNDNERPIFDKTLFVKKTAISKVQFSTTHFVSKDSNFDRHIFGNTFLSKDTVITNGTFLQQNFLSILQ